jgi:hydroxyethylthiazole kinase-like uncharacterized protein yjeF
MTEPGRPEPVTLTPSALRDWPLPVPEGGKDKRGTVLVVGGSRSTPGAVLLAGTAALRAGAGVLQLAVAASTAASLSIAVPEALVVGLPETGSGSVRGDAAAELGDLVAQARAVLVGPGLDDVDQTGALLRGVLDRIGPESALALDAYALGALSRDRALVEPVAGRLVLTPNPTEAGILLGQDPAGDEPGAPGDLADAAARIARRYSGVVSVHGRIADPDGNRWADETGDAGLGTSGSGDVLAGLVAGLLARGATPTQAACWASHVHAAAGQRLIPRFGRLGFLARELVDEAPRVLAELQV